MKIKNTINGNKGTVVSIVAGLAIAGLGVAKMLFTGKDEEAAYESGENYSEDYDVDETEESEPTEEATDEPE